MHVCLDYRPALHEGTGVGTYVRGLLRGLLEVFPDDRYTAFSASLRNRITQPADLRHAAFVDARFPVRALDWLWHRHGWPGVERWVGPIDVAHSPSPMPMPTRAASVITIHDCYFLRHPEDVVGPMRRDYGPLLRGAVERADAIMTVSNSTRDELCELLSVGSDKVHVAHLGVDPEFRRRAALDPTAAGGRVDRLRSRFGLERPFLLFVGRREPRKDLGTLLAAFDDVLERLPDIDLVLAGPDGHRWSEIWDAASPRVRARARTIPHQQAAVLADLYAGAEALVLSSRWEGFGLTPLEAMTVGTPVAATRAGSLPEVLGGAAAWAEVADPSGLADAIVRVVADTGERTRLVAAGHERADRYRWSDTARTTHAVYESLEQRR